MNLRSLALAAVSFVATSAVLIAAAPAPPPLGTKDTEVAGVRGITEPYRSLILKAGGKRQPPWSGKIAKVLVEEGDTVEVGQILIELDKSE